MQSTHRWKLRLICAGNGFDIWFFTVLMIVLVSRICGDLLSSKNLAHAEADTGTVGAVSAGRLRRFCQVVTVALSKGAALLSVLPEETPPAASGTIGMILDAVDDNDSICHFLTPFGISEGIKKQAYSPKENALVLLCILFILIY